MPSGPPKLHEFWSNYYGDNWPDERLIGSGDLAAERYLRDAGFTLTRGWQWTHSTYKSIEDLTELEYSAVSYLVMEWDYGGVIFTGT